MRMKKSPAAMNRRRFLNTAAAAAAACTLVPRHVLGGPRFVAPSEKVNIAIIGAGGQGRTNVRTRKKIHWDTANLKAVNVPEADPYIQEQYRAGWEIH
jgi:hypothetical protein